MSSDEDSVPERLKEFEVKFIAYCTLYSRHPELKAFINKIHLLKTDNETKELIDQVVAVYLESHNDNELKLEVKNLMFDFFNVCYTLKKNCRKLLYQKLNTVQIGSNTLFEFLMISVITEVYEDINEHNIYVPKCTMILTFLQHYMLNLETSTDYEYFIKTTSLFYVCILEAFSCQILSNTYIDNTNDILSILKKAECCNLLDSTFKHLQIAIVRINNPNVITNPVNFVRYYQEIIKFLIKHEIKYDLSYRCTLLWSCFLKNLPPGEKAYLEYKEYPILNYIGNDLNPDFRLTLYNCRLENIFYPDKMKAIFYSVMFHSVSMKSLLNEKYGDHSIFQLIYTNLIFYAKLYSSDPEQIILISRTLSEMSEHLGQLDNFTLIFDEGLLFSWVHLEHVMESVVHFTKTFFKKLIQWAKQLDNENHLLDTLFRTLNSMAHFSKVRLTSMEIICDNIEVNVILQNFEDVQKYLLSVIPDSNLGIMAGDTYMNLMKKHLRQLDEDGFINIWMQPVLDIIRNSTPRNLNVYQEILTYGFDLKPMIFTKMFIPRTVSNSAESVVVLRCIHLARMKGITLVIDPEEKDDYWRDLILKKRLETFMIHHSDDVRLWVLRIIVNTPKTTEEITEWEILYLLSYFSYNVSSQTPCVVRQIAALYKKLFVRFQASFNLLLKEISRTEHVLHNNENDEESMALLKLLGRMRNQYRGFVIQFVSILLNNLSPDASFSRRNLSLELLLTLRPIATESEWLKSFGRDEVANLKSILYDSYECNKSMTVELLKTLPPYHIGFDRELASREFFENSLLMASDIRPSKSLTASYLFQVYLQSPFKIPERIEGNQHKELRHQILVALTERIERTFKMCRGNLIEASQNHSLHGLLLCVKTLLKTREIKKSNDTQFYCTFFKKLVTLCLDISKTVSPTVSSPAPEGHIPDDHMESLVLMDRASTAQKVLVFAWKTMKEITSLLAEIVVQAIQLAKLQKDTLPTETIIKIGDFFVNTFIQTKHRGVFETTSVAFRAMCKELADSENCRLHALPNEWFNLAVNICTGEKYEGRICATRRSAGLPFLMLGLMRVQAESNMQMFNQALDKLLEVASNTNNTNEEMVKSRIHCLNTLRFLFNNSQLSELVPAFVGKGAIASILGFRSKIWGVRNAAMLLYAAVITRMFGVQRTQDSENLSPKNRMTLYVFNVRYPSLFEFLLDTLSGECNKVNSQVIYPILLILSRLYPSYNDKINDQVQKYIPCINICISNPSYTVRDLAARALMSLISMKSISNYLMEIFTKISNRSIKDAECHGLLLQVWHLLRTNKSIEELPVAEYLTRSLYVLGEAGKKFSHLTVSFYMEVISLLLIRFDLNCTQSPNRRERLRNDHFQALNNLEILRQIVHLTAEQPTDIKFSTCRYKFEWNRLKLLFVIFLNKFQHVDTTFDLLTREIFRSLYSDNIQMKKNCLYLLIYLNQVVSDDLFKEHPIITLGDLQIPSSVQELVEALGLNSRRRLLGSCHPYLRCFFFGEMKNMRNRTNIECFNLILILMKFYPCIFSNLHLGGDQNLLNFFMEMAKMCDDEELIASIIAILGVFVSAKNLNEVARLDFTELIKLLMKCASPAAENYRRLAAAQFLANAQCLFRIKILKDLDLYNILNIVVVLLEDEDAIVRRTMCFYRKKDTKNISFDPVIAEFLPDKIRGDIMTHGASLLKTEVAVGFLASWSIRFLPEATSDADGAELYDRGELNTYAENIPITYGAVKILNNVLWPVPEPLSYDDKSIFVEEQTLLVTSIILNSLIKVPSPMVDKQTKTTVICALKCITNFLENLEIGGDFQLNFRNFFSNKIMAFFRSSLSLDFVSVKSLFTYIYNPVLKINTRFPK